MVLVFDLDDTLYDEREYVESGLRAVALFGQARFGWKWEPSFRFMVEVLDTEGRGAIFDRWLASHGRLSKKMVRTCVYHYRHHTPLIKVYDQAAALLPKLKMFPLYIVTDGHKEVQKLKVEALGIAPLFRRVFITHRHGMINAKPSIHCFDIIRKAEKCEWKEITYFGDNPAKDFVNLNRKGANTVRVLTGMHKAIKAADGYEARYTISHLGQLIDLLPVLQQRVIARS